MPAIQTTEPETEPVLLEETKDHLKVDTSDDDDLITQLIITARKQIEHQIDKVLITQSWAIYADGWPQDSVFDLSIGPVTEIESLRTYDEDDVATEIEVGNFYADLINIPQRLILSDVRAWSSPERSVNGIRVDVVAGYGDDGDGVPAPLRQAILLLVSHWYENRQLDQIDPGALTVSSKLQSLLAPYKQVRL